ncbi:hypothetical protein BJY04DRAFT_214689 [Aspergillus karnatakaensis]|uniref:uncharacterized protein n=1 Tax=Aspergillus karnatakaensis TaxID=1810916 RepID=UPI003CCD5A6E
MTSPAVTAAPHTRPAIISPTFSQKDIYTALMASGNQNPKSLDVVADAAGNSSNNNNNNNNTGQSSSAFEVIIPF